MILGLDLGQHIGWCLGNAVGPMRHGTFPLENSTDLGVWLRSSDEFFMSILDEDITGIGVEQPFLGESYYPARKLLALLGHLYWHASYKGISASLIQEVPVPTGKLALSGMGHATKEQMIEAATAQGYPGITTEHEADALGIWWVYVFGRAEPIRKPHSRSGKGRVITP